jgi:hypothetical protein
MKKYLPAALLMIVVSYGCAQDITTVAGGNGFGSDSIHLWYPYGVWLDQSGYIYVTDHTDNTESNSNYGTNSRVQRFPPGSNPATGGTTVAGGNGAGSSLNQLINPAGIFVDGTGNIYVADPGYTPDPGLSNNRIMKFPAGSTSASYGTAVAGGIGTGDLAYQLSDPLAAFVDDSGYIYVADADNNRIQKFPPNSNSNTYGVTVAGGRGIGGSAYQLSLPSAVLADDSGHIYVADYQNNRIQKFTPPDSNAVTVAGGNGQGQGATQLNAPTGIFMDKRGNLYVADFYNNRIQMFPPGSDSATAGITVAGGNGPGDAPDQLYNPATVYVDSSGAIYIADYLNNRIQRWAASPAGINTVSVENVNLYPNPNKGSFILHSNDMTGNDFVVYDMIGRKVAEQKITSNKQAVLLKSISAGTYTLEIKGNTEKTLRFIIGN